MRFIFYQISSVMCKKTLVLWLKLLLYLAVDFWAWDSELLEVAHCQSPVVLDNFL